VINPEGIVEMLKSGLSVKQIADIKGCSESSVHRLGAGNITAVRRIDWIIGDELIKEGCTDSKIAIRLDCSIKSVRARRLHKHGIGRRYLTADHHFDYKGWLEEKLQALYQAFSKDIPWSYDQWRAWLKTQYGQMYLELAFSSPDEHCTERKHTEEYSIGNGRVGRMGAQP
jgi:DNA-binding CsgD family transcriptional regulator